jgi:hypothetical protein
MLIFLPMKFLKVLTNAVVCGLFFSGLIALLTYDININLPFETGAFLRLALATAVAYGPIVVPAVVAIFFVVQFFSGRKFDVKAVSPSFLAVAFPPLIALFLFIFWENLLYFASFFDPAHATLLRAQGTALTALAVLGATALYASRRYGKKLVPLGAYFALFAVGMILLAGLRARFPAPHPGARSGRFEARTIGRKILLVGLEGMSLDIIFPLIAEGKLPNFSWLVDNGGWGRLGTLAPTETFLLERSLETGKRPAKHRQLSLYAYEPVLEAPRLEVTPRYVLFRQMIRLGLLKVLPNVPPPGPADLGRIFEANGSSSLIVAPAPGDAPGDADPRSVRAFNQVFKTDGSETGPLLATARKAFARDWALEEGAFTEKGRLSPGYFHLRLDGLNTVQAFFYKYSFPEQFGNIAPEDINRYGSVISRYYEYYDTVVGKYLASLKDDDLLVVYSPYGVEPLPLWKRFVEWILGNPEVSAYHEDRPDGAVFFYGNGIGKRNTIEGMKIVDIAPTLLYYLGLPVGKDMDGIVQSPVFVGDFTAENPIFSISSYEEIEFRTPAR